jgi:hypothetical protein
MNCTHATSTEVFDGKTFRIDRCDYGCDQLLIVLKYEQIEKVFTPLELKTNIDELQKWRTWKPNDEDLRELQEQAKARDGSYTNGLAAQAAYIGALEAEVRRLENQNITFRDISR